VYFLENYENDRLDLIEVVKVDASKLLESMEKLAEKIRSKSVAGKKADYDAVIAELEQIVRQYKSVINSEAVCDREEGLYLIPAQSEVVVEADTYCLDSGAAIPKKNELYILTKSEPDLPVFRELMTYTNSRETLDRQRKQRLLWNLHNRVKFESLPVNDQALLLRADPAALLKMESYLKESIGNMLLSTVHLQKEAKKAARLARGTAHSYEEYAANLEKQVSAYKLPENRGPVKADGYDIYTLIEPSGYRNARITFINEGKEEIRVFGYFKPYRKDVQPLAFDLPGAYDESMKEKLRQAFGKLISVSADSLLGGRLGAGDRLTIEENPEKLVDIWKAFLDSEKALALTAEMCKKNPGMCGPDLRNCGGDAFRHAVWNALMYRDVGEFGAKVANNHELNEGTEEEKEMDRINNRAGWEIGRRLAEEGITGDREIADEVVKSLEKLKVIKK